MRLTRIRDFLAVVEAGGIGAAARRMGLSQPALTKSLRALEAEVGLPLVQRTARGVVPTRYGKILYARARSAQAELTRAEQELRELAGDGAGAVAFGFGPVAANLIVPEAISLFRAQFPDASLRLIEGFVHHLAPLVRDDTLDFAIGPGLTEYRGQPGLKFRPLFHYERAVAGRRHHPLAKAGALRRLGQAQWLTFEPQGTLEKMFADLGLPMPRSAVQSDSATVALRLLGSSDMVGILPRPMLSGSPLLREIEVSDALPPFTIGIFTRADTPLTPAASAMAHIVTTIGRRVASGRRAPPDATP